MHLTRAALNKAVPLPRKGSKYIARPMSHLQTSISVLVAVRDMLKLAHTTREVRHMIKQKLLKINGRDVKDVRQPIHILNLFDADKRYKLILLPTKRFFLEETSDKTRIAKIIGKKVINGGLIQFNFHDGTNILSKERFPVGDSVLLNTDNTVSKVIPLNKGSHAFIYSGRNVGLKGSIAAREDKQISIKLSDRLVSLGEGHVIAV